MLNGFVNVYGVTMGISKVILCRKYVELYNNDNNNNDNN